MEGRTALLSGRWSDNRAVGSSKQRDQPRQEIFLSGCGSEGGALWNQTAVHEVRSCEPGALIVICIGDGLWKDNNGAGSSRQLYLAD